MTSQLGWRAPLQNLRPNNGHLRVAVLGIGHELRGDDAVGVMVARGLVQAGFALRPETLVIEAGSAPENFTGPLRRFQPDWVVLVDAAELGLAPGAIQWLDWRETVGLSASTHTLPLALLGQFLTTELACRVALIGIQPATTALDAPLSASAQEACEAVVRALLDTANDCAAPSVKRV